MIRAHGPLLKTVAAAFCAFFAVCALRFDSLSRSTLSIDVFFAFLLGLAYTQFFEFWVHRFPMHRGVRFLENIRRNHLEHHRVFHGENFRTRRPSHLRHIAGRWWVFPLLFFLHYLCALALLPIDAAVAFLFGCVVHYAAFEVSHWLTHVEGNGVDRVLLSIPVVGSLRSFQIEHHRLHHETPKFAYNFNPPYLGDRFSGLLSLPESAAHAKPQPMPPPSTGAPVILARRRFLTHQLVRYGAAAAIGVAAVGLVVLAHGRARRAREDFHARDFPHTPSRRA
jgi:hypothetical protein